MYLLLLAAFLVVASFVFGVYFRHVYRADFDHRVDSRDYVGNDIIAGNDSDSDDNSVDWLDVHFRLGELNQAARQSIDKDAHIHELRMMLILANQGREHAQDKLQKALDTLAEERERHRTGPHRRACNTST